MYGQDEIDRLTAKYERARKDLESHSQLQVEYENLVQQTAKWYFAGEQPHKKNLYLMLLIPSGRTTSET